MISDVQHKSGSTDWKLRDIYNLIECCHYHSQYIDKVGEKWFNFWQGKGKYMHFQNLATTRFLSDFRWISKKKNTSCIFLKW